MRRIKGCYKSEIEEREMRCRNIEIRELREMATGRAILERRRLERDEVRHSE